MISDGGITGHGTPIVRCIVDLGYDLTWNLERTYSLCHAVRQENCRGHITEKG